MLGNLVLDLGVSSNFGFLKQLQSQFIVSLSRKFAFIDGILVIEVVFGLFYKFMRHFLFLRQKRDFINQILLNLLKGGLVPEPVSSSSVVQTRH